MKHVLLSLTLLCIAGCSRTIHVLQPSVSMEACRIDEETRTIFVPTNPLGASFSLVLGPIDHGVCTVYAKFGSFKERKEFLLFCLNTGDLCSPIAMYPLTIEDEYIIEVHGNEEIRKHAFAFPLPAIPGFQSTWYLWAKDDSMRLCQTTIVNPLQMVGSDGATLSIIRRESGGNFVEARASGLREGEQVCLILRSLGEQMYYPYKVREDGTMVLPLISSVAGLKHGILCGTTNIRLVRQYEALELSSDWDLSTTTKAAPKR